MIRTRYLIAGILVGIVISAAGLGRATYKHHFPNWWYRQAVCIHRHESTNWRAATGNGFFGGFQFMLGTWHRVGGHGYPHLASPNEQYFRTWLIWRQDGGSWREWPNTSRACGL